MRRLTRTQGRKALGKEEKQLAAILNPIRLNLIEIQRRLRILRPRCADTGPRNPRFVSPHDKTRHFHAELFTYNSSLYVSH